MTTLPLDGTEPPAEEMSLVSSLQERLAESLVILRRRAGAPASIDARIALVGALLMSAGVVLVLLGWYGASNTSRVYLQIPYLISGGLLGVVLAVAGGCTYMASWLTRLVQDQQTRTSEAVAASRDAADALARIEQLLAGSAMVGGRTASSDSTEGYVVTPSGKLAHRPGCATVAGRSDLRPVTVGPDGPAVCRMCDDNA